MTEFRTLQFRVSRAAGKGITRLVAALTLYRMPPFVSVSAIVADGDRILVVVDPIRNEPVLPGGHLRWHESPESALVREVHEETGYEVGVRELEGVFSGVDRTGDPGVVRVVYEAVLAGGELRSSPEGEARWTGIAELSDSATRDAAIIRHWLQQRQTAR